MQQVIKAETHPLEWKVVSSRRHSNDDSRWVTKGVGMKRGEKRPNLWEVLHSEGRQGMNRSGSKQKGGGRTKKV